MKSCRIVLALTLITLPVVAESKGEWWKLFKNESLNTLIEKGLAEHPEPLAALQAVDGARASRQLVSATRKPAADLSLSYRFGREKTMYTDREEGDIDPLAGSARISWEIDLFGRARQAIHAADARVEMTEAERKGVRLLLSTAIAATYFKAAALKEKDHADRDLLLDAVSQYRRVSARVGAGLQDQPSLEKAVSDIQMALHHRMLTNIDQQKIMNELTSLVGEEIEIADTPLLSDFMLPLVPDYDADMRMQGRPDVLAAWWRVESMRADAQSTKAARAPTFELVASAAAQADEEGAEPWEAWVGPVLKLPLWRPDLKADSVRVQSRAAGAQAAFEAVSLSAMREINDAIVGREHADSMIAHLSFRHQNLEKIEAAAKRKYDAGLTRQDDFLLARRDQLMSRHEQITWRREALMDHLSLIKALGGSFASEE